VSIDRLWYHKNGLDALDAPEGTLSTPWHAGCFSFSVGPPLAGEGSGTHPKTRGFAMAALLKVSAHHHKIALLAVLSFLALC
jgi:hypothetical protein